MTFLRVIALAPDLLRACATHVCSRQTLEAIKTMPRDVRPGQMSHIAYRLTISYSKFQIECVAVLPAPSWRNKVKGLFEMCFSHGIDRCAIRNHDFLYIFEIMVYKVSTKWLPNSKTIGGPVNARCNGVIARSPLAIGEAGEQAQNKHGVRPTRCSTPLV